MSIQSFFYNAIFKRTSTFMLAIVGGSFFFERAIDVASDTIFESYNKGKLWKDIKHKYET
ncbi:cytochrome b-c1 complex subunit 9 [Diachasma alloeum]|uniref:Complex III subunit 9 n=1 Tax=Diachasma alloeum TaxID=454923 RepID=A0A4E0S4J2_9HYME|nr:cytochrome b-c1 complex subunit 9 [Diachasma alloeum]THK33123.1 7.2 kDa subunit, ubiquinol-cytochrome c reductase [Diachasma alloeum]